MQNYKKNEKLPKTSKKHQKRRRRGPGPLLKDAACKISKHKHTWEIIKIYCKKQLKHVF